MATRTTTKNDAMFERALQLVPGGAYGHAAMTPPGLPRFFATGKGALITDVDGNEYIDFMCGYGPNLLGMRHERVEEAAATQRSLGDCFSGPTPQWIDLAEALVERINHADWAMFNKNGTDATTLCMTVSRNNTGKRKILVARDAYHGAAPWCTPSMGGVLPEDRAHLVYYRYNDLDSINEVLTGIEGDVSGIIVSPFKHDAFVDQELPTQEFASGVREICDRLDAHLIIDEVRGGFRTCRGGSWEHLGVDADLSAWGKALGNGYAISAVVGTEATREGATTVYTTGSFWYAGVAMAAANETLRVADEIDLPGILGTSGSRFRNGLDDLAATYGFSLRQTGPVSMPMIIFDDDDDLGKGTFFSENAADQGVYWHPYHNMFLSAAHTADVIDEALGRLERSFDALRTHVGDNG